MTCHKIAGAIICTADNFVSLKPYGADVWCEYHEWLGPHFFRSEKSTVEIEPWPAIWRAYRAWRKEVEGKSDEREVSR